MYRAAVALALMLSVFAFVLAGAPTAAAQDGAEHCGDINLSEQWVTVYNGNAPMVCIDPTGLENGVLYADPVLCTSGYFTAIVGYENYLLCSSPDNPQPDPWNGCDQAGYIPVDGICQLDPDLVICDVGSSAYEGICVPDSEIDTGEPPIRPIEDSYERLGMAEVIVDSTSCTSAPWLESAEIGPFYMGNQLMMVADGVADDMQLVVLEDGRYCYIPAANLGSITDGASESGGSSQINPTDGTATDDDGSADIESSSGPSSTVPELSNEEVIASVSVLPSTGGGPKTSGTSLLGLIVLGALCLGVGLIISRSQFWQQMAERSVMVASQAKDRHSHEN